MPGEGVLTWAAQGGHFASKEQLRVGLQEIEGNDGASMRHFDLMYFIFFAFYRNLLFDYFEGAPLVIQKVLCLIFVELLLPEVGGIDSGRRKGPC